ncbi:HNH endonuclease [Nocardioides cynanchi]|uniref:HNH endonuclease n=1 Tax=Nocardioides cynanchi TaxID=2558918 RepID=UPI001244388A|nr:HNH endonuclease signature motif containing protein [Nocardioides cynanchi]
MRKDSGVPAAGGRAAGRASSGSGVGSWVDVLSELEAGALDEPSALDLITTLERLKRAASAAQARLGVRVEQLARRRQRAEGLPADRLGAGVATQVALARRESPHRGSRHLGLGRALVFELPRTLEAMCRGDVSEWQATLVARETAGLDPDTRRAVDERIADRLPGWGDAQTAREVRRLSYAADPGAAAAGRAKAASERRVTLRPAPDSMCLLTALIPAVQGVATYAALVRESDRARAGGDDRGKGQVMADTLVTRVTGQSAAPDVPVEVELVMPADTLLGDGHTPAHLVGYGPLPAAHARGLLRDSRAEAWVRRLFVRPEGGQLVAMDSRRRRFSGQLRHLVVLRDQFCRMPWCDAPIRHADHPVPRRSHGPTRSDNAQGLCEACNYTKEAPGWRSEVAATEPRHLVAVTTPTGHRYTSAAPDPPGQGPVVPPPVWRLEQPGVWSILARAG